MLIFWEDCADVLQAPFTLHTHPAHVQCCSLVQDQLLCLLTLLSCFIFGVKVWIKKTLKLGQTFCLNHAHINTLRYITAVLFFTGPLFFFWGGGAGFLLFCQSNCPLRDEEFFFQDDITMARKAIPAFQREQRGTFTGTRLPLIIDPASSGSPR